MKRKRLDRDIWTDIVQKRYYQRKMRIEGFDGFAMLLHIDGITKPSDWEVLGKSISVVSPGMVWLQMLPRRGDYVITAMVQNNSITLWYIDIIDGYGFADDGILWYDDLYLDLVVLPDGQMLIDDMDELEDALQQGDVSQFQFDNAIRTMNHLQINIREDLTGFVALCERCLYEMKRYASVVSSQTIM